ncbi:hypothetical protein BDZ89DRAFT_1066995, partial [Hymenopellis radicata]
MCAIEAMYNGVAAETQGHYLVGMNPKEFMETFMPWNVDTLPSYRSKIDSIPEKRLRDLHSIASKTKEEDMYSAFTAAFQGWPIETVAEAEGADVIVTKFGGFRKPDGECRNLAVDVGHYTEVNLPSDKVTVHRLMESNAEFKVSAAADPFVDPPNTNGATADSMVIHTHGETTDAVDNAAEYSDNNGSFSDGAANPLSPGSCSPSIPAGLAFSSSSNASAESAIPDILIMENDWPAESKSQLGLKTRGQIASYAGITMFLSYRKHFMSVVLFGEYARLIFWDRRGAIVSRRFNYQKGDDKILFEFYLRFSQLTTEQRGHDPTVVELDEDDSDAKAALVQFKKYDRDMWHCNAEMKPLKRPEGLPKDRFLRMIVKFGDSAERSFIIPAPIFETTCLSPFSRSTRRSLANEREQFKKSKHGSLLFMKDYWREDSPRTRPEAEIYGILAEKNVPHVATMVVGGDVEGMRTKTQEACLKRSAFPLGDHTYFRFQNPLQCHRIFLDTIARDLSAFGNCRVLVNCVADAMEADECAFAYARILHRDISSGNIMITPAHRGILIDWDLAYLLQGGNEKQSVVHTLDDDKESAFWVLVYVALRYLKHPLEPTELYLKLVQLFDTKALDKFGRQKGGDIKELELPRCAKDSCRLTKFETLRRHAKTIPFPPNLRLPGGVWPYPPPGMARASTVKRALEDTSPTTIYDFHQNEFYSTEVAVGTKTLKAKSLASIGQRLEGMGARR